MLQQHGGQMQVAVEKVMTLSSCHVVQVNCDTVTTGCTASESSLLNYVGDYTLDSIGRKSQACEGFDVQESMQVEQHEHGEHAGRFELTQAPRASQSTVKLVACIEIAADCHQTRQVTTMTTLTSHINHCQECDPQ